MSKQRMSEESMFKLEPNTFHQPASEAEYV
jgi:hypothetical protein